MATETTKTQFHFISGLPRAGSTLLSALLRQNPRFHADITSPLGALFLAMLRNMSAGSEHATRFAPPQREAILRGLFSSYYGSVAERPVVFDTSRLWCARLPAIKSLFPGSKVIACVRNVAWVMDSIERIYQSQPFENSMLFNDETERNTVFSRVDTLAQRDRLVGFAWSALKEAFYGPNADMLLVVDYDLLTQAPAQVMGLVYQFIGEEPYEHDFDNVVFDTPEFDAALGLDGMHRVHSRVRFEPRRTMLPPDLFEQYNSLSFWRDQTSSAAHVIIARSTDPSDSLQRAPHSTAPTMKG